MVIVKCSHAGCTYATEDVDVTVVVELLKIHAMSHAPTHASAPPPPPTQT